MGYFAISTVSTNDGITMVQQVMMYLRVQVVKPMFCHIES